MDCEIPGHFFREPFGWDGACMKRRRIYGTSLCILGEHADVCHNPEKVMDAHPKKANRWEVYFRRRTCAVNRQSVAVSEERPLRSLSTEVCCMTSRAVTEGRVVEH